MQAARQRVSLCSGRGEAAILNVQWLMMRRYGPSPVSRSNQGHNWYTVSRGRQSKVGSKQASRRQAKPASTEYSPHTQPSWTFNDKTHSPASSRAREGCRSIKSWPSPTRSSSRLFVLLPPLSCHSCWSSRARQLLLEIEQKAAFASQQLQIVRGQITSKNRESRLLQLSAVELDTLPKETPVYDGVGKM